jgi:hypothetical protein
MGSQRQPADRLSHQRGNQVREEESATRALQQTDDDIARYLRCASTVPVMRHSVAL